MPTYQPVPGSLPWRVCAFLIANPEEVLSIADIAAKFNCTRSSVQAGLEAAVANKVLERRVEPDGQRVYAPGSAISTIQTQAAPAAASPGIVSRPAATTAAKRGGSRQQLPVLDLASLTVRESAPMPLRIGAAKGLTRYDGIFEKLTKPGQSVLLPRAYSAAVQKAIQVYSKRTSQQFKVRTVDADQCGIWRTA